MEYAITGIQQVGIGVENLEEAWAWYRKQFGMDVPIFKDAGEASFMARYTGGKGRRRVAVLAASMHGGGAFEVWQYTERTPAAPAEPIQLGDLGIYTVGIKARDLTRSFSLHSKAGITLNGAAVADPQNRRCYLAADPYGNVFRIEEDSEVFHHTEHAAGGVKGAVIGVSDIEKAMPLYAGVLGYDKVVFDSTGVFEDLAPLPGGKNRFRRIRLAQTKRNTGGFSPLLGSTYLELLQALDTKPKKIFENRFWGDKGYIHLCFDIRGMDSLKSACEKAGFPFTVDSSDTFEMGEANGRFAYTEDPDGTLIELVEAFKVALVKKIGLYLNLEKRNPLKPIPKWMLKALRFARIKDRG
ncbi:MAG: VOC family protein [Spirochaetales bacterium]|nr:VOC family protein [Spirochaetales bacterium]